MSQLQMIYDAYDALAVRRGDPVSVRSLRAVLAMTADEVTAALQGIRGDRAVTLDRVAGTLAIAAWAARFA